MDLNQIVEALTSPPLKSACPNWAPVLPPVAEPVIKFMDGTPVPADYLERVSKLVSEAADGDPGGQGED